MRKAMLATALLCALALAGCGARRPTVNTLELGDSALKRQTLVVGEGAIYSAASGGRISFEQLVDRLASARVVYLGEQHTSMATHRIQRRIIEALHDRGLELKIGMEFFRRGDAAALAQWTAGELSEEELLRRTGWYAGGGGYNFGYYRPILQFAQERRVPVFGMNVPRAIVRKVAMGGLASLSPEEKLEVGDVDLGDAEHRELIEFYFAGASDEGPMRVTPERFENMYAAQRTWDSVMAASVARQLEGFDGTVVVIVGSGHVAYNLGMNLLLHAQTRLPYRTVLAIAEDRDGGRVVRSLAHYLWGIRADTDPPHYPDIGLSARDREGSVVVGMLMPDSMAAQAGLKTGDVIVALDGRPVADVTDLKIALAAKRWGDAVALLVRRAGEELQIDIALEKSER